MNIEENEKESDGTYGQVKRMYFEMNNQFSGNIARRRTDFIDLLLKGMSNSKEALLARDDLFRRFGFRVITETTMANAVTMLVDGEVVLKK